MSEQAYRDRVVKRLTKNLSGGDCIIVCDEKYATFYYSAFHVEQLFKACLSILKRRKEEKFYYDEESEVIDILNTDDGIRAYEFLLNRDGYGCEYEGFRLEYLERV